MNPNITLKETKTQVTVFKETIIKVGETTIPTPIGVDINPKTGKIKVPVKITPLCDAVLTPEIVKDLLINEGFIKLQLTFKVSELETCPDVRKIITKEVFVPIQSVHKIDHICPDDNIHERTKIKAITIRGIPDNSMPNSVGTKINLIIKVILEVKLTISREVVVCAPVRRRSSGIRSFTCSMSKWRTS